MAKPRFNTRLGLAFLYDLFMVVLAWIAAFQLRFNFSLSAPDSAAMLKGLAVLLPIQATIHWLLSLYKGIWRFASLSDLKRIVLASFLGTMACSLLFALLKMHGPVPRSVLVMYPILLVVFMGGSRMAYRAWREHRIAALLHPEAKPVLVLGAGSAADFLLRELARTPSGYRVVGLLDDDPDKIGRRIQDVPVLGPLRELERRARQMEVGDVILAMPSAHHALRQQLTDLCSKGGLNVLTVPSLEDLMQGRVSVSALRPIQLDDLLGRDPVRLDSEGLHGLLADRGVLVTGAGGSIGAELCRQIARFRPATLVLLEQSEFALYQIEQEFAARHPDLALACVIGDVKDDARVAQVMSQYRPSVVFHAAAYKHVPLMEENALQALKNNVLGTFVVARAARRAGVEKFVMVSTDKAVNPTNVMGASKRLAEMVCQVLRPQAASASNADAEPLSPDPSPRGGGESGGTRFVSVRFGNVLGSSGSVIPKFQAQIEAGGPVTVTHPEINRYFMSIPEAAQLVLQAGLMGQGGEIFVLDMGEPVRIADLARLMIKLAGKTEDEIRIVYTGLRPGEKLYEELLADAETTLATPHPKLRVALARPVQDSQIREILDWIMHTAQAEDIQVRRRLSQWLPEYRAVEREAAA
jgi:FlaA1/EpsC-like NDP-sugar epimerase